MDVQTLLSERLSASRPRSHQVGTFGGCRGSCVFDDDHDNNNDIDNQMDGKVIQKATPLSAARPNKFASSA